LFHESRHISSRLFHGGHNKIKAVGTRCLHVFVCVSVRVSVCSTNRIHAKPLTAKCQCTCYTHQSLAASA